MGLSRVEFVVQSADSRSFQSSQSTSAAENFQSDQRQLRYAVDWAEREEIEETIDEGCSRDEYEGAKAFKANMGSSREKQRGMLPSRINNGNSRVKKRKRVEERSIEEEKIFDDLNWAGIDNRPIGGLEFSGSQSNLIACTCCFHELLF